MGKSNIDTDALNRNILATGERMWHQMQGEMPSLFNPKHWQSHILDWVMEDEAFKVDAFHFVDVLPALQSSQAISTHIQDYLLGEERKLPVFLRRVLSFASGGIIAPVATRAIKRNVSEMARRFICESDAQKAVSVLSELCEHNLTFTADILGEASTSEGEAKAYLDRYLNLIEVLAQAAKEWPENKFLYESPLGPLPKANISVKISALDPHIDPVDMEGTVSRLQKRIIPLLKRAKKYHVFVNFDMEQWACHDITYKLFESIALLPEFRNWPHLGVVIQAYLKESEADYDFLLALSRKRGTPFTVRLVKGAYWDYEVIHARQNGFDCPVFTNKGRTDVQYERLTLKLMVQSKLLTPAFASHNLRSVLYAVEVAKKLHLDPASFEIQMLYGMAEPQRKALSEMGQRVRVYAPIGDLLPGMAYLVRRLLENTSNSGFLRQSYHEGVAIGDMLVQPVIGPELVLNSGFEAGNIHSKFANVDLLDFTNAGIRLKFAKEIVRCAETFPGRVPLVIDGNSIFTKKRVQQYSPNDPEMIITDVSQGSVKQVDEAVVKSHSAYPEWRDRPLVERALMIDKLAIILERDRVELAALQVHEVGKPWLEADGDVAEAIDFCRYYARQAILELGEEKQGDMAGESNVLFYEGRGVTAVIAPWNFPLAILCGMTTAALVAGNPVIIKPAASSANIGHEFYLRVLEAGIPADVVHFLPGKGSVVGNYLVEHPQVSQIAFTGSKEVGLGIIQKAAQVHSGQAQVKRVVCEMGGKNGMIIDDDCDLDAAIKGTLAATFGYAGQKCSACSRLILVGDVFGPFLKRFIEACATYPIKPATDPACKLGPVIDQGAYERLLALVEQTPNDSKLLFKGKVIRPGYFVPPTVFEVSDPNHFLMQEEFFGPVLTVIQAKDFKEAVEIANNTEFALTGGLFSRSPRNIEYTRKHFKVGNLYLNRSCTGALVGRQPFGGFQMSGIGTKAGGVGYLRNFADPRCITENTMRSGFTPEFQM